MKYFTLGFLSLTHLIFSQQYITGELSGLLQPGEYIVSGTVYVLKNQKLQIAPGVKLYFEQFSAITVLGEIRCDGNKDEPVIFTSVKEYPILKSTESPDVFDWNGIEIGNEAAFISLDFAIIKNCTFGLKIKSEKTKIRLNNVQFFNIGYTCISRNGKLIEVKNDIPYSCLWNIDQTDKQMQVYNNQNSFSLKSQPSAYASKAVKAEKPFEKSTAKSIKRKIFIGSSIGSACSGIALIAFSVKTRNNKNSYSDQKSPQMATYYRQQHDRNYAWKCASASFFSLATISAVLAFAF